MRYSPQDLIIDCLLPRNSLNRIQRSFLRFYLNNLFIKFNNLGLVVEDPIFEGFPLMKTLLLLMFEFVEFLFTSLTGVPFDLCLIKIRFNLKVIILSKIDVLDELSKKGIKLDEVLDH